MQQSIFVKMLVLIKQQQKKLKIQEFREALLQDWLNIQELTPMGGFFTELTLLCKRWGIPPVNSASGSCVYYDQSCRFRFYFGCGLVAPERFQWFVN